MRSARTGGSHSSRLKMTPANFEDIDRYAAGGKRKKGEEEVEIPDPTLMDQIQQNAAALGCLAVLMLITLLASSIPGMGLWLAGLQVLAIGLMSVNWEGDQYLGRGGYRICCQLFFVAFPIAIGVLILMIAGEVNCAACRLLRCGTAADRSNRHGTCSLVVGVCKRACCCCRVFLFLRTHSLRGCSCRCMLTCDPRVPLLVRHQGHNDGFTGGVTTDSLEK